MIIFMISLALAFMMGTIILQGKRIRRVEEMNERIVQDIHELIPLMNKVTETLKIFPPELATLEQRLRQSQGKPWDYGQIGPFPPHNTHPP
jgi:hypothetical protein